MMYWFGLSDEQKEKLIYLVKLFPGEKGLSNVYKIDKFLHEKYLLIFSNNLPGICEHDKFIPRLIDEYYAELDERSSK